MTEQQQRRLVCDMAESLLGRKEADGSHRAIIDLYNEIRPLPRGYKVTYTDAWCATFVSAVGHACGLERIILSECSCPKMIQLYKAAGRWMEDDAYRPQPGDLIFYDWQDDGQGDNVGQADHVGLVLSVDGEAITVIEGNCGHAVATRRLQRDGRYIRGYGLPDYASVSDAEPAEPESPPEQPEAPAVPDPDTVTLPKLPEGWHYVPLPDLQLNDESGAVRAAQLLLKGHGYSIGWMGADGEYGPKTENAVGKFRRDREIVSDIVIGVGPETWAKLICD